MSETFPEGFLWGAAAASYQIEGGARADGRSDSVWDVLSRWPGKVADGHTGDVACNHYQRYEDDAALMADLGLQAYRLSIAWSRLFPDGTGSANEAGLEYYDRVIDALLERGVQPWVTLFHWDLPNALQRRGGFLNPNMPDWFADYTATIAKRYGDRVTNWFTLNEPACFIGLGLRDGIHAPGWVLPIGEVLVAQHHALMAHGRAVQELREHCKAAPRIGCAPTGKIGIPASTAQTDLDAAYDWTFDLDLPDVSIFHYGFMGDPAILGRYPEGFDEHFGHLMPKGYKHDFAVMKQPIDFFGMNIYNGKTIRAGDDGRPAEVERPVGHPVTMMDWPVTPDCLSWGVKHAVKRYGLPVYITENGCASMDWVASDGCVHDAARVDYLDRHLAALRNAVVKDEADCAGYFHWSIMDNFEWAEGYRKRFGLVYIDYATQERIPKDSFRRYQEIIRTRGACLPADPAPLR